MTEKAPANCNSTAVRDVLAEAERQLAAASVERALLDAEWIVAHVLDAGRLELPFFDNRDLTISEIERIFELVGRRACREPLQYVLGNALFSDLDLKVDSRVLIPRPETEELLERIVESLKECPDEILDLGTGSGALALGLARAFPKAEVVAVDQSSEALVLAKENTERNGLRDRVSFVSSDWFERVDGTFDLIVSNPPYLNDLEWKACEPEIRNYEPKTALVSEPEDSAADLKRIVETASPRIRPGGLLALETGENHHAVLVELATKLGYLEARGIADLRGRPRFFFARRPD